MLFAFLTDWGNGEKLNLLWLLVPTALIVQTVRAYRRRYDFDDCVGWCFAALLVLVVTLGGVFGAESNRRETAQLTEQLGTLDLTVEQVTTSTPFTVVRLGNCRVTLDVRHPGEHRWTAGIKDDADVQLPVGPRLYTQLEQYCKTKTRD